MAYSDDYLRQLRKRAAGAPAVDTGSALKLFCRYLTEIPEELCSDIFDFFCGHGSDDAVEAARAEHLSDVIDLFEGEYDEKNIPLSDEELEYISEGVNDYAVDIDDETLMNVMKAAVARGLMG